MRRGGIFSLGAVTGPVPTLNLFPGLPVNDGVKAIQSWMQMAGANNVAVDGKWGQCSHSAFKNVTGTAPTPDTVASLLRIVPAANVKVWQPGPYDICQNGTDKYTPPPAEVQAVTPEPGVLLANMLGIPIPADFCGNGRVLDSNDRCACPAGTYENVNTGGCDQLESPQKNVPGATNTTTKTTASAFPRITASLATSMSSLASRITGTPGSGGAATQTVKPGTIPAKTTRPVLISSGIQKIVPRMPGAQLPAAPAGMSTGAKVAIGVVALAGVGAIVWLLSKRSGSVVSETVPEGLVPGDDMLANCYRRNCGW